MESPALPRRVRLLTFVLALTTATILMSGLIASWFIANHLYYRSFRWSHLDRGALWHDEIVFAEFAFDPSGVGSHPDGPGKLMALNPEMGTIRDMGITIPVAAQGMVSIYDTLWIVSTAEVLEINGTNVIRHHPEFTLRHVWDGSFNPIQHGREPEYRNLSIPFSWNGKLTGVAIDFEGRHRIYTFENGDWQPGKPIAPPRMDRLWTEDPKRPELQISLHNPENEVFGENESDWRSLRVVQVGDEMHLISEFMIHTSATESFVAFAYQVGFDFASEDDNIPSALAPANTTPSTVVLSKLERADLGLPPVPVNVGGEFRVVSNRDGSVWNTAKQESKSFEPITPPAFASSSENMTFSSNLFTSSAHDRAYLIADRVCSKSDHFRLTHNGFEKRPSVLPGICWPYLLWQAKTIAITLFFITIPNCILLFGGQRLSHRWQTGNFSYGIKTVSLAPLALRWKARAIDVGVSVAPLMLATLWYLGTKPKMHVIGTISQIRLHLIKMLLGFSFSFEPDPTFFRQTTVAYILAGLFTIVFLAVSIVIQGRSGFTLGKWLCNIRVVRTTLSPCGFARSLLRELILFLDTLDFLLPIPGVMSLVFTQNRQRIGDRLADTIVIKAKDSA